MAEPTTNIPQQPDAATEPAGWILHFRSERADVPEAVRLRALLKCLLRRLHFRAVELVPNRDASRASATAQAKPNHGEGQRHE